ncbi:MAG: hypothetical protein QMD85_05465, partial [Candidatus Aenigmarchaeota archaeon]|nr:hypothetical protein [Candidatus Aenigmarchaeota archaeon]
PCGAVARARTTRTKMSNFYYGKDILQSALFRAGERTDLSGGSISDFLDAAKQYVMRGYYDTVIEYPWPLSLSSPPGIINTLDKETGTATVTKGSAAATLGATVATSLTGRKFYIDNEAVLYRIAAHTGGTADVTLDATYKEDSGSGAFTVYQDEFSLASDCITIRSAWDRTDPQFPIEIIPEQMMRDLRSFGIGTEGWRVEELAVIEGGKVRIRPWPPAARTIEYVYSKRPAELTWDATANDIPAIIDAEHRHLLSDYAVAFLLQDKRDPGWSDMLKLYSVTLLKMKARHSLAQHMRSYPRPGQGIWR